MKKVVLLKSPTCMPCKILSPMMKAVCEQLQIEYKEHMVTEGDGLAISQSLSVRQVPAYALYENDTLVKHATGNISKEKLIEWLTE